MNKKGTNFKTIPLLGDWSSFREKQGWDMHSNHSRFDRTFNKSTIYLCSGSRPKGRRSSGLRCTPACCWYTCYCGKRKHLPHRELMRGKNG